MKVVEEYVRGDGSSIDLGIKYDISSGLLRKWIRMYNANRELKDYNPKHEEKQHWKSGKKSLITVSIIIVTIKTLLQNLTFLIARFIPG